MRNTDRILRILFITSDKYPPHRPAAHVIFGKELGRRGHRVDWILQAEKLCTESFEERIGNGRLHVGATDDGESRWRRVRKHALDLINDLKMFRLAKGNRYDVIQVKDKYLSAMLGILAARRSGAHFVYWLAYPHAEASLHAAREKIARYRYFYLLRGLLFKFLLYKLILPMAGHIFVQSEQMKKDINAEGIPLSRMTPVPGSLSLEDIPYDPSWLDDPGGRHGEKRIVYLGTLMRARRLDFLIRVLAQVLETEPLAKLYLLGKGNMPSDEEFLRNEAEKNGVAHAMVFTGYLLMSEALEYIRRADVCVSPYYPTPILNSTSPTKLIEYMAMGKAVVGNDHPEQSLVIAQSGAGISVPWEETEFARAIVAILKDPEKARQMGKLGRTYVEKHRTNSMMADLVEKEYLRLVSNGGVYSTPLRNPSE